jgi:hypothetical protein
MNMASAEDAMVYFNISDDEWDRMPISVRQKLRQYVRNA